MKTLRLTLAGAALAAALPALAASGTATTAAPAANDTVAPQATKPAPAKVALATPQTTAPRAPRHSVSDTPARKYDAAQARPNKPYSLEHARWTHDEDHQY
jgi:hypothetical protein